MNFLLYAANTPDATLICQFAELLKSKFPGCKIGAIGYRSSMEGQILNKNRHLFTSLFIESDVEKKEFDVPIKYKLSDFEAMVKKPSWKYIYQDRTISLKRDFFGYRFDQWNFRNPSKSEMIFERKVNGILNVIDAVNPSYVICIGIDVSPISTLVIEDLKEHYEYKLICPRHARVRPWFFLNDSIYNRNEKFDFVLNKIYKDQANNIPIKLSSTTNELSTYKNPVLKKTKMTIRQRLYKIKVLFKNFINYLDIDPYSYNPTLYRFRLFNLNSLILKRLNRNSLAEKDIPEKFIFFPLHVIPEMSTLVYAPYYVNQLRAIEALSMSIPANYTLIVKEHKLPYIKAAKFYKHLKTLPNVKMAKSDIPSSTLIKKAGLVAVITGTAGLEAVMMGKNVIVFGNCFFHKVKGIHVVKNLENLPEVIMDCLRKKNEPQKEVVLKALEESTKKYPLEKHLLQNEEDKQDYFNTLFERITMDLYEPENASK